MILELLSCKYVNREQTIKARIAVVKLLSQQKTTVIVTREVVLEMKRRGQIGDILGIFSQ